MSKKPLYGPMMDTIKPYREKLMQAKRQLDDAWKGESGLQPIVTNAETNDVLELKESLSRVSNRLAFLKLSKGFRTRKTFLHAQKFITKHSIFDNFENKNIFFKVFRD